MEKQDRDLLIRMDENLKGLKDSFDAHVTNHNADVKELDKRVDSLDKFRSWMLGGLGVLVFLAGFAWLIIRMI